LPFGTSTCRVAIALLVGTCTCWIAIRLPFGWSRDRLRRRMVSGCDALRCRLVGGPWIYRGNRLGLDQLRSLGWCHHFGVVGR
jgi:hypothetical protein